MHPGGQVRQAYAGTSAAPEEPKIRFFHSVRQKLLLLVTVLALLPLAGLSIFSYVAGGNQIRDRIRFSLEKMAQDTADKMDLLLRAKKEELHSMATTSPLVLRHASPPGWDRMIPLLNNYCFNHEGYDALLVVDATGAVVAVNTTDRDMAPIPRARLERVLGRNISEFPEERRLFAASIQGQHSHADWYASAIAGALCDYEDEDGSHRYNIALSEPFRDPATREITGVWINIVNWSLFQNVLDNVELDLAGMELPTGFGFLTAGDANTVIGHRDRKNRPGSASPADAYGARFTEDFGILALGDAVRNRQRGSGYRMPDGARKLAGIAPVSDTAFGWNVGVEVDETDILRPLRKLGFWLALTTGALALPVVFFTWMTARRITLSLRALIRSARTMARGNFRQRVPLRSSDELGILAATFNEMGDALSAREVQLQELTRNLEAMVRERTLELENSHEALKRAYFDLQSAQEQLVQTEKMASLGQLVSGIAHEIKNPLNFIYGNTGFLGEYTEKLQSLVEGLDRLPSLSDEDREEIARRKEEIHYAFIKEDLKILIGNFAEGAHRINTIVSDLRTFSRMDTDAVSDVDLHASIEMSLNLLRNQYRNRIEIHKEYGDLPRIQGYAGKLNQVMMNLLSNAFAAVREKGDVWIRTRRQGDGVEIEIEDNGVGIPAENLKRIFEPFFTTKPVGQGTGLGLSISYGIIEQHQGKIEVSGAPGGGSVFTVRLPVIQEKSR